MFISIKDAMKQGSGKVAVRGWIYRFRNSNKMAFLVLRDASDIIQCVVDREKIGEDVWKSVEKLLIESSVEIEGAIHEDKRAPTGYEIKVSNLNVVQFAEVFPITKDQSVEFLLDKRHLWIRSRKITAIMKIRSTVFSAIDDFFRSRGFYEVAPPILTPSSCEGGATLFEVKYFDDVAYLTQSWQLYAEAMIFSLEKIYCNSPCFRAEKSKTSRHLAEFYMAEMEVAWARLNDAVDYAEDLICFIVSRVLEKNEEELKILNRDIEKLKKIKKPFKRMTYTEVLEELKKDNIEIEWGKDLRTIEEDELMKKFDKPVIVTNYPKDIMAFYKPRDSKDPKTALCFDMLAPEGYGEIVGGSERDTNIEELKKSIKHKGEKQENYEWYLDTRRFGSVPHSGFGMGVERVVSWICGLDNIKDAIPFPRTMLRKNP
ncbi:asparagine--tRNA ligase [archaeon]|nr:asparagine--tRNA ligase [archaeon]